VEQGTVTKLSSQQLDQLWTEHLKGEFETKDVEATLATMVDDAYVNMPVNTGGRGKEALRIFYRDDFIPSWPGDVDIIPTNRVVGDGQLVDELHLTFSHSKPMNWFLPNVPRPTRRSRLISWWWCSFGATNLPVNASIGITRPSFGKWVY